MTTELKQTLKNDIFYLIALSDIKGIGNQFLLKLIRHNISLAHLFEDPHYFEKSLKLSSDIISNIKTINLKNNYSLNEVKAWLDESENNQIIKITDHNYPELLKEIHSPPPFLYIKGNIESLSSDQIAIVGTRNASEYGLNNAYNFSNKLAESNYTITSGLAIGIDTQAHKGALNANGQTIAVLGTGLKQIYPFQNKKLADQMIENGAIVSEFPLNNKPDRFNFPRRNRIISGLSMGTLVVESSQKSGSLITANYALEQNREVFAIPGSIHHKNTQGVHQLIQQGAKLATSVDDIISELYPSVIKQKDNKQIKNPQITLNFTQNDDQSALSEIQMQVLSLIDYQITPIDIIIGRVDISLSEIYEHLLTLELMQKIKAIPGGYKKL